MEINEQGPLTRKFGSYNQGIPQGCYLVSDFVFDGNTPDKLIIDGVEMDKAIESVCDIFLEQLLPPGMVFAVAVKNCPAYCPAFSNPPGISPNCDWLMPKICTMLCFITSRFSVSCSFIWGASSLNEVIKAAKPKKKDIISGQTIAEIVSNGR